jgi:hypothetical protein
MKGRNCLYTCFVLLTFSPLLFFGGAHFLGLTLVRQVLLPLEPLHQPSPLLWFHCVHPLLSLRLSKVPVLTVYLLWNLSSVQFFTVCPLVCKF